MHFLGDGKLRTNSERLRGRYLHAKAFLEAGDDVVGGLGNSKGSIFTTGLNGEVIYKHSKNYTRPQDISTVYNSLEHMPFITMVRAQR